MLGDSLQTWRVETTEQGSCQSTRDTQRAVSPQRDSCANLIFECQWLESRGSQKEQPNEAFLQNLPRLSFPVMCASKEVRCSGSLIVSLVPHNFTFLLCESEQKNKRHVTRGSRALVMNNFSCKRHIQGTKLLKENKKSILPKASYSGEDSIKAFTLGVTSSRLYAWDVQHRLVKRNKLKQQWYSLGVQRLLTNHKKLLCLSPHMLGVTDHLSSVIWHETSGRWQWSWTRRSRLDCVCRGVT